jgi:hypothetical protein
VPPLSSDTRHAAGIISAEKLTSTVFSAYAFVINRQNIPRHNKATDVSGF